MRDTHLYNLQHLSFTDVPVPVQVVHTEGPLQLLLQLAAGCHTQSDDKLPKIYRPVTVGVESAKDVLGELGSVSVWKEVPVNLLELLHGQVPAGAVPQEALVPLLDLVLGEVCALQQVLHHLGTELAVLLPHVCLSCQSLSSLLGGRHRGKTV